MVANIVYSPKSEQDLEQIGDYIEKTLKNPTAALKAVNRIQNKADKLADFPLMGTRLSSIMPIDTDYRFLVCGKYLAFYRVQADDVYIDRVLYGKRDYIAILFGELLHDDEDD